LTDRKGIQPIKCIGGTVPGEVYQLSMRACCLQVRNWHFVTE